MENGGQTHVHLTDKIRRCIRTILTKENLPDETRRELLKYSSNRRGAGSPNGRTIPFHLVKTVQEFLNKQPSGGPYLHELLEGSDVHLPHYEPPARDPELEARCERLRAEQSNKEYQKMTSNVNLNKKKEDTLAGLGHDMKAMNSQLIAIVNFLVTVGGAFVFGYKSVEYSLDSPNVPMQMLVGLMLATIVFFADLYFLVKQDMEN